MKDVLWYDITLGPSVNFECHMSVIHVECNRPVRFNVIQGKNICSWFLSFGAGAAGNLYLVEEM